MYALCIGVRPKASRISQRMRSVTARRWWSSFAVEPVGFGVEGAGEVVDPEGGVDDDHGRLAAGAAEARLVQVSLPLDLAAELADGGLGVGLDEEAEGGVDYDLLSGGAGALHGLLKQGVVGFNVGCALACF